MAAVSKGAAAQVQYALRRRKGFEGFLTDPDLPLPFRGQEAAVGDSTVETVVEDYLRADEEVTRAVQAARAELDA